MKWNILLAVLLLLCGCARKEAEPQTVVVSAITAAGQPQSDIYQVKTAVPGLALGIQNAMDMEAEVLVPILPVILETEAPGTLEERTDEAVIDYSNTADGYVMAKYTAPTDKRLKLRVSGPTTTYTYNLPAGEWTVCPLSDGEGEYRVTIYSNISGTRYAQVSSVTFPVVLENEFAPFLRPNQYVNYTDAPMSMEQASQLCAGIKSPLEKVAAVYDYVVAELSYDTVKASEVKSGYLPVLDQVLKEKKGICFDYAALMTAMLRSQEVPCKLVVGYAGSVYHAWISVWTEEDGWVDGVIFFDGQIWKRMDPTFASSSQRSEEIMNFIESGQYVTKYLY